MKSLGLNFAQNDLRFVVLSKDNETVSIISKEKIVYPKMDIPALMHWFETQLSLLIDNHEPDMIGYKVALGLGTIKQVQHSYYPQGILNFVCKKKNIQAHFWTSQGIKRYEIW